MISQPNSKDLQLRARPGNGKAISNITLGPSKQEIHCQSIRFHWNTLCHVLYLYLLIDGDALFTKNRYNNHIPNCPFDRYFNSKIDCAGVDYHGNDA